ncbi:hypothetical protein Esti_005685 [Eimeria stiedai]
MLVGGERNFALERKGVSSFKASGTTDILNVAGAEDEIFLQTLKEKVLPYEGIGSFEELANYLRDLQPKNAPQAQALLSGEIKTQPPYGPLIVNVWKVQLGESGRGNLKRDLSERISSFPFLKPPVNAISKIKTATVEQLVIISEIVGLLKKTLQIAQRYEVERAPFIRFLSTPKRQHRSRASNNNNNANAAHDLFNVKNVVGATVQQRKAARLSQRAAASRPAKMRRREVISQETVNSSVSGSPYCRHHSSANESFCGIHCVEQATISEETSATPAEVGLSRFSKTFSSGEIGHNCEIRDILGSAEGNGDDDALGLELQQRMSTEPSATQEPLLQLADNENSTITPFGSNDAEKHMKKMKSFEEETSNVSYQGAVSFKGGVSTFSPAFFQDEDHAEVSRTACCEFMSNCLESNEQVNQQPDNGDIASSIVALMLQNQRLRKHSDLQHRQVKNFAREIFCIYKNLMAKVLREVTSAILLTADNQAIKRPPQQVDQLAAELKAFQTSHPPAQFANAHLNCLTSTSTQTETDLCLSFQRKAPFVASIESIQFLEESMIPMIVNQEAG